ncbi:MAG: sugar kinase [Fimbriimonadales bacterium]
MSLLGLDVGTSGAKAIVFAEDGKTLGSGYREYPLLQPQPGWAELDPELVWRGVCEAVREAVSSAGRADPVRALAVSSQGEAVVPVDERMRPLANSAVSFCIRTMGYERVWDGRLSERQLYQITGQKLSHIYTAMKLMWLRDHQPAVFRNARRFLCYGDYVLARMGGEPAIDFSNAARTFCFDVQRACWSEEVLDATGLEPARLAPALPCGTPVGTIAKDVAQDLGLPSDVLLVVGAHDQPAGALGAGVVEPGVAVDSIGTVECLTAASDRLVLNDAAFASGFPCYAHAVPGLYVSLAWVFSGGSILRWFRDILCRGVVAEAQAAGADPYDVLLRDAPEGPSEVLLLPYFAGSATPNYDSNAKGAIVGLTLSTTRGEVLKAALDGISYEMRLLLDLWDGAGIPVERIRAVGGGAKSDLWLQQKADVYERPVARVNVADAACLGMAFAAGSACGVYASMEEAAGAVVRETEVFEPRPSFSSRYGEARSRYAQMYRATRNLA